ncbi:tyrosine-type recombinase/integrase [Saccharopolyspora sp. 5N708]|uniref:tyrosine-type recombinase/integrase n=1 Tax=Saccharopolyspora sp. 5N708 TaxID=3457424 RepID=UPI003FD1E965
MDAVLGCRSSAAPVIGTDCCALGSSAKPILLAVSARIARDDLRHTYASWILQDGVPIEALSKLLGHASVTTTERYSHLADTQWDAVRAALDGKPKTAVQPQAETSTESPNEQSGEKFAPYLLHAGQKEAGAKIIDLSSRRRSAG